MNTETQTKDYQKSVIIKANQIGVFKAVTERIDEWWGEVDIQPDADDVKFRVSFGEAFWRFRVADFELNKRVSWECIESNQVHAGLRGIREEWLGTKLHWELIGNSDDQTKLSFTHEGLVPDFNCYEVCSDAWGFFIGNSLKALVESGTGQPELI
ncbi:MAG: hypothetical protein HEP71_13280 [Roseivirga sp.]|nr:hypothetical protein [Roseivirga sp.]